MPVYFPQPIAAIDSRFPHAEKRGVFLLTYGTLMSLHQTLWDVPFVPLREGLSGWSWLELAFTDIRRQDGEDTPLRPGTPVWVRVEARNIWGYYPYPAWEMPLVVSENGGRPVVTVNMDLVEQQFGGFGYVAPVPWGYWGPFWGSGGSFRHGWSGRHGHGGRRGRHGKGH